MSCSRLWLQSLLAPAGLLAARQGNAPFRPVDCPSAAACASAASCLHAVLPAIMPALSHHQALLSEVDCPAHESLSKLAPHDSSLSTSPSTGQQFAKWEWLQIVTNCIALQLSQILSRLQQLRERISAAENLVALELDHRRNQLFTFRVVRKDMSLKGNGAGSFL